MKAYATQSIRNVGIVGHGDTGKTQLVSSLLFTAGMTPRLGRVAEGSSVTDWDEEEIARKISIQTGLAYAEWVGSSSGPGASAAAEKTKLNFLDTPGYGTFVNETKCSLIAADATLILIDARHGVQVVTEKVWDYATVYDLPRAFVINWMDRDLANFERALHSVEQVFGRGVVAAQLPIGQERSFRGVVDLVTMKAHVYKPAGDGKPQIAEIREKGTLPVEDLLPGLRDGVQSKRIFPVLCSSALRNVGSASLLNFMVDVFPHPAMRKASGFKQSPHSMAAGAHAGTPTASQGAAKSEPIERKIADTEPLSVYVFKTMADAFAGRISYFKVMSGLLKNDATLTNFNRGTPERFQHIHATQGKTGVEVPEIHAGDIGSLAKLKETMTGETLGDKSAPVFYKPVQLPEPSITFAIEPKTRADEDRVGVAIHNILEEDLAMRC